METHEMLNLIFQGLTAVGTVGAVIISLMLATKESKIKTSISYTYTYDVKNSDMRSFDIMIANLSSKKVINIQNFMLKTPKAWVRVSNINKLLNHSDVCKIQIPFYKLFDFLVEASNQEIDLVDMIFVDSLGNTYTKKLSIEESGLNYDLDTSSPKEDYFPNVFFEEMPDFNKIDEYIEENIGKLPIVVQDENSKMKPTKKKVITKK